jgi:hypothetical protein
MGLCRELPDECLYVPADPAWIRVRVGRDERYTHSANGIRDTPGGE